MAFIRNDSDALYAIYKCIHVPTSAVLFLRVSKDTENDRAVVRHIQQNLKRPTTSRSPEDRKFVSKFVEDNRFDLTANGIDRDWVTQIVKVIPERSVPAFLLECVTGARKSGKLVLNTTEKNKSQAKLTLVS